MHIEIGGASEVDRLSLPGELIAILHGRQDAWCQTRPRPPPGGRGPGGGRRWARQVGSSAGGHHWQRPLTLAATTVDARLGTSQGGKSGAGGARRGRGGPAAGGPVR